MAGALALCGCTNTVQVRAQRTAAFPSTWDEPYAAAAAAAAAPAGPAAPVREAAATPASAPSGAAPALQGKLAVLDFRSYAAELKAEDVRYFTDLVRGATLRAAPRLEVMTRENLLVLLSAEGKDLASCEGECEVDTGRRIGADAVVSGEVLKVGSRYKMSLKLHDTHQGRLLSTSIASGGTVEELDDAVQNAAVELFSERAR